MRKVIIKALQPRLSGSLVSSALTAIIVFSLVMACGTDELEYDAGIDVTADTTVDVPIPDVELDFPVDTTPDLVPDPVEDLTPDPVEEEIPTVACPLPGPYGTRKGNITNDMAFPSIDGGNVGFCDFRRDTTRKLLLVYSAAGW